MTKANWRDTLFIWDGILETELEKKDPVKVVHWKGTWTGTESAIAKKAEAPKRGAFEEFVTSDMKFEVDGTATATDDNKDADERKPFLASFTKGAGWDLKDEEGDGEMKKHSDEIHDILLPSLRWTGDFNNQFIFASGKNEFGPFVSAGWMRPGNRLTIARRYIEEGDERCKWDLETLAKKTKTEIYDEKTQQYKIPPWQCGLFNTEMATKKRTADDEEKEEESAKKK